MGFLFDSVIIQLGTGYNSVQKDTIEYFVIWKSSELRIVSTFTLTEKAETYTIIADANTVARDAYITSYKYEEIHKKFCNGGDAKNSSQITNNTYLSSSNSNSSQIVNDDDVLTDKSCNDLIDITTWLNTATTLYIITISFVGLTTIIWLSLKLLNPINGIITKTDNINCVKCINNMNTKILLKLLLVFCYISLISAVFTLIMLLVAYFYIIPKVVVDAIILTDFKQDRVTFGPTILMLIVNILVTSVTIYSAFYSRTPGFTFIVWNNTNREDSDDSLDA